MLSSNPKKPSFAVAPSCQRNSTPLSFESLELGEVSPPNVIIGSSTVTVVLLTVVVVPLICKLASNIIVCVLPPVCAIVDPVKVRLFAVRVNPSYVKFALYLGLRAPCGRHQNQQNGGNHHATKCCPSGNHHVLEYS